MVDLTITMQISKGIEFIRNPYLKSTEKTCWADLGCGEGFFTGILSGLLNEGSTIYAVDQDERALVRVRAAVDAAIGRVAGTGTAVETRTGRVVGTVAGAARSIHLHTVALDFVHDEWPFDGPLDGILMANSLHYVGEKGPFISRLKNQLKPDGGLLLVEYDTDRSNPWVPYPVSWQALEKLCHRSGFGSVRKIHEGPSRFGRAGIYSAWIAGMKGR